MTASSNGDGRLVVDPDKICLRDMQRARVMLGGENPWEVLGNRKDPERRIALIIWMLRSRTEPDYTLDDALDAPASSYAMADDDPEPPRDWDDQDPNPVGASGSPGPDASRPVAKRSRKTRSAPEPGRSSASSSASPASSTRT